MPQLQEMVELGGMKIKKIHATRFVEVRSPKYTWLTFDILEEDGRQSPKLYQLELETCEQSVRT